MNRFFAVLLFLMVPLATAAFAQPTTPPSQSLFSAPLAEQDVPTVRVHGISEREVETLRTSATDGPLQYGVNQPVRIRSDENGTWTALPNGDWLWRVRITSAGARNLSAHLDGTLPEGTEVYVYGDAYQSARRPIRASRWVLDTYRTPHVRGDALYLEARVPARDRADFSLEVNDIVHGFLPLDEVLAGQFTKSGSCNIDVACDVADPWSNQVDSVVRYTYSNGTGSFVCTGSLVTTTETSFDPYVLTAEHCVTTDAIANSMVFYFNYQNPTCRTPGSSESGTVTNDDPRDQTISGAELRMSFGNVESSGSIQGGPDVTLVELSSPVPLEYDTFFNGWSIEGTAPPSAVTIHHPAGHGKRISFEDDPTAITGYLEDSAGSSTHLRVEDWDEGTTEGGSSGSPLYDTEKRVVGVLSGGFAACGNDRADWYGRIAEAWEGGGTPETRLRDWLDPNSTGATVTDGRRRTLDPDDTTPPSAPADLSVLANPPTSEVRLRWTAPSDDADGASAVYTYDVRYATSPITTEAEFDDAARVTFADSPGSPGATDQIIFSLVPELSYYFAVRAVDDNFNVSTQTGTPSATALPDEIPPSRPSDVTANILDRASNTLQLQWTAPGDDRMLRVVDRYDIRYAETPIRTEADFEAATPIEGPDTPTGPGQTERVELTAEPNTPYYFAVRAIDNQDNESRLGVTDENRAVATSTLALTPPAPSRVTESVSFRVASSERQTVDVAIYDILGRRVLVVFNDVIDADQARSVNNLDLSQLSSGRYFIRALGESGATTRGISVVR